jgi:hypothetical protein
MHPVETSFDIRRERIVDVARLLRVYRSTVSRVSDNSSALPASAIEGIQAAMKSVSRRVDPKAAASMLSRRVYELEGFPAGMGVPVCESKSEASRPTSHTEGVSVEGKAAVERDGCGSQVFGLSDLGADARSYARMLRARRIVGSSLPPEQETGLPSDLPWDSLSFVSPQQGDSRPEPHLHRVVSNRFHSMLQVYVACRALDCRHVESILRNRSERHQADCRIVHGSCRAGCTRGRFDQVAPESVMIAEVRIEQIEESSSREICDAIITGDGGFFFGADPRSLVLGLSSKVIVIGRLKRLVILYHKPNPQCAVVAERAELIGEVAVESLVVPFENGSGVVRIMPLGVRVRGRVRHGPRLPSRVRFDVSETACPPENLQTRSSRCGRRPPHLSNRCFAFQSPPCSR